VYSCGYRGARLCIISSSEKKDRPEGRGDILSAPSKMTVVESKDEQYDCESAHDELKSSPHPAVFFYGTLLVPAILARVLGHKCQGLSFQDAIAPVRSRDTPL
jgi:hypothetical protein